MSRRSTAAKPGTRSAASAGGVRPARLPCRRRGRSGFVFNQFTQFVANASGWAYAVVFLLALLDAVLPVVPSETAVITGGVVAASGRLSLPLVVTFATVGAMAGDNAAYLIGRRFGSDVTNRFFRSEKAQHEWPGRSASSVSAAVS